MRQAVLKTQYFRPDEAWLDPACSFLSEKISDAASCYTFDSEKQKSMYGSIPDKSYRCSASYKNTENKSLDSWLVLCIGTDRMTGDCLGPLVGSRLVSQGPAFPIYGTLRHPVHAGNLHSYISQIRADHPGHRILAVDASTGSREHVGSISVSSSPLLPGDGFSRNLPPVGDVSIKGIVADTELIPQWTLPYTRLYLVDTLAEFISRCILRCLVHIHLIASNTSPISPSIQIDLSSISPGQKASP